MSRTERLNKIVDLVNAHGTLEVAQLSELFRVSEVTIRNDLNELSQDGKVRRVRGGATLVDEAEREMTSLTFPQRQELFSLEKAYIGDFAANLIDDGDTLLFDASSTVACIARSLKKRSDLKGITVITNGLKIITEIIDCPNIQLVCIGGSASSLAQSFVGPLAEAYLKTIHVSKTFVSPKGVSIEHGLSDWSPFEASIRADMLEAADRKIVVCDHSKLGAAYPFKIGDLDRVNTLVTDQLPGDSEMAFLDNLNIEVLLAQC